ncbi:AMP-binding protein [Nocardia niigatensis]
MTAPLLDAIRARRSRSNPVIGNSTRQLGPGEVFDQAADVAAWLGRHTPRHSAVVIAVDDDLDWLALVVGAVLAERVVLPYDADADDHLAEILARVRPVGVLRVLGTPATGIEGFEPRDTAAVCRGVEFLPCRELPRVFAPDACYVSVSSGSTGRSKVIVGSRTGLAQFLNAESLLLQQITGTSEFSTLRLAPASFDVFWRDTLLPLISGGTLWCPDRFAQRRDPHQLAAAIETTEATLVHTVPSLARALAPLLPQRPLPSLKAVLFAGEPLHPADVRPWLEHTAAAPINVYGTSETTLAKFLHVVTAVDLDRARIPVGTCIPGAAAIAFTDGRPCYPGEPGEIYIATSAPIHGYLGSDGSEVFVANPIDPDGAPVHRTGDIGVFDDTGVLELVGRTDDLVKVRGQQVHLRDVETALRAHPNVTDCAVVVDRPHGGDQLLYGYVVTDETVRDTEELLDWLDTRVSAASVPQALIRVPAIPYGPRGKLDRDVLHAYLARYAALSPDTAELDPITETVMTAFRAVLPGRPEVDAHTSFRALGGQSIHAAQLANRLEDDGIDVSVMEVLTLRSPEKIAAAARARGRRDAHPPASRMHTPEIGVRAPITQAQARFLRLMRGRGHQHPAFRYLWAAEIAGDVTADALAAAVEAACREQLLHRLRIDNETAEQYIDSNDSTVPIDEIPSAAHRHELRGWLTRWARRAIDATDPPLRFAIRPATAATPLQFAVTGTVAWSDGGSKDALLRRISAHLAGKPTDPAPAFTTYSRWEAAWLDTPQAARRQAFWRTELPAALAEPGPGLAAGLRKFGSGAGVVTRWRSRTVPTESPVFAAARDAGSTINAAVFWGFLHALNRSSAALGALVMYPDPNRRIGESEVYGCLTETLLLDRRAVPAISPEGAAYVGHAIARGFDHALPLEAVLRQHYPQIVADPCSEAVHLPVMFAPQPPLSDALTIPEATITVRAETSALDQIPFPVLAAPIIAGTTAELRLGIAAIPGLPDIDTLMNAWAAALTLPERNR